MKAQNKRFKGVKIRKTSNAIMNQLKRKKQHKNEQRNNFKETHREAEGVGILFPDSKTHSFAPESLGKHNESNPFC